MLGASGQTCGRRPSGRKHSGEIGGGAVQISASGGGGGGGGGCGRGGGAASGDAGGDGLGSGGEMACDHGGGGGEEGGVDSGKAVVTAVEGIGAGAARGDFTGGAAEEHVVNEGEDLGGAEAALSGAHFWPTREKCEYLAVVAGYEPIIAWQKGRGAVELAPRTHTVTYTRDGSA